MSRSPDRPLPLHRQLLDWYDANRREMPWRDHPDPYAVWVSEIMLQQTQVETVRGYFARFLRAFPTVSALAEAPLQDVLKAWEGLGYYSRARNLQQAARRLADAGGQLPRDAAGWRALPGVGPYTAAAIASISFQEPVPVVDGNVARVFSRFLEWADDFRRPAAREKLAAWLQPPIEASRRPGDFNQAMMDLGATVCLPHAPACGRCPLHDGCRARRSGRQSEFPARPAKKAAPTRVAAAALVRDSQGRTLFVQRPAEGLLGGLWELPAVELAGRAPAPRDALRALREQAGLRGRSPTPLGTVSHAFSHFRLLLHVFAARLPAQDAAAPASASARFAQPGELPLTTATRRALALAQADAPDARKAVARGRQKR